MVVLVNKVIVNSYAISDIFQFDQPLGLTIRNREIDLRHGGSGFSHHLVGFANAGLGLPGAGFGPAAQPFDLIVNQIFQRFLTFGLGVQKFFFLFQENAVVPTHAQHAIRIDPAQFSHVGGDIFQKITVVTHDHGGECGFRKQGLEPLDAREIQMICGFIEQQEIRHLHQRLDDG